MTHPYTSEYVQRRDYIERSKEQLLDALSASNVRKSLGWSATSSLVLLAESMYMPKVSETGVVTITPAPNKSAIDAVPVIALADGEQAMRDRTFAEFSLWQYECAQHEQVKYFNTIASRVAGDEPDTFLAQTFEQEAAVARKIYCLAEFPTAQQSMYFNLRPLVVLRYDAEAQNIKPAKLANALVMAQYVIENPVTVVADEQAFDALNAAWSARGDVVEFVANGLSGKFYY